MLFLDGSKFFLIVTDGLFVGFIFNGIGYGKS